MLPVKKNEASSHHKKEITVFLCFPVLYFYVHLNPPPRFTLYNYTMYMEINLTVTQAAAVQVTVKSCCRYVLCLVNTIYIMVVDLVDR